jgi:hypothetical protein
LAHADNKTTRAILKIFLIILSLINLPIYTTKQN